MRVPQVTITYDEQSAAWQQGYDDFYSWVDDGDLVDPDPDANMFANAPLMTDDEKASAVLYAKSERADYHRGWDHANFENAYEGYKLAKGGPESDG